MLRIVRKSFSAMAVATGADRVLALMPIPPRGRFLGMRGSVQAVAEDVPKHTALYWPVRAYACQMTDTSDLVDSWDDLWDRWVPKDGDVSEAAGTYQLDVDTDNVDQDVFEEPGEASPNELFGLSEPSRLLWKDEELITIASSPIGYEGAGVDSYVGARIYQPSWSGSIRFPQGGFVALAMAAPEWDDVQTTVPTAMANITDILMYANLPDFLHTARLALIGATESGAETPAVDVLSLIEELVEPTVYEQSDGLFSTTQPRVWTKMVFQVGIAENPDTKVLKSD